VAGARADKCNRDFRQLRWGVSLQWFCAHAAHQNLLEGDQCFTNCEPLPV
jgi:hypothetical protein